MIGEAPIERIGRPEILTVGRWWQRYVELISKLNVGGVDGHRTGAGNKLDGAEGHSIPS